MEEIQEITFSGSAVLGYCITGLVYLILPFAAFFLMKRCSRVSAFPVIAGAVTYFLATRAADITVLLVLGSAGFAMQSAAAAEMVCFTEEIGRWLAMKYPLSGVRSTYTAVCFGIGHGGLECLMRSFDSFRMTSRAHIVNTEGIARYIAGKTAGQAEAIAEQLQGFADYSVLAALAGSLNIIAAFGFHIALSLLVYRKLIDSDRRLRWLALAIGLHLFCNGLPWIASFAGSAALTSITGFISCTAVIYFVYRIIDGRAVLDEILCPPEE